jgi:FMN phosphatase YigB (HAD superfamily)
MQVTAARRSGMQACWYSRPRAEGPASLEIERIGCRRRLGKRNANSAKRSALLQDFDH